MSEKNYRPKSGINAGKINLERIKEYLRKHPNATGAEISRALGLSRATTYSHLKTLKHGPGWE